MPTFFDSTADAADASEGRRGLAHASREFERPAEMYGVIGDLSSGMRSLRQALDQIADVHERKVAHAFNDAGSHEAEVRDALATEEELRQTASLVDRADDRLAAGFIAAGRIAWHPDPAVEEGAPSRWVSVVFLQGEEAVRPLRILDELGHVDAVDFPAQWDYGDETTQTALENGYVYEEPGEGTNDRVALSGAYALVVNPHVGCVSLLRRYIEPEAAPQDAEQIESAPAQAGPELLASYSSPGAPERADLPTAKRDGSWFAPAKIMVVKQARGWCCDRGSCAAAHRPSGVPVEGAAEVPQAAPQGRGQAPRRAAKHRARRREGEGGPRKSMPSGAPRSTCPRRESLVLRGYARRVGSI